MPDKVFISYSNPDVENARHLANDIEQNGFDVWFAPSELSGGDRLSTIHSHIESAKYAVVLLSKASINSKWVQHEMNTAIALSLDGRAISVIPVFLDNVDRPVAIADLVSVNLETHNYNNGLAELLAILKGEFFEHKTRTVLFQDYLHSLPVLEKAIYDQISSLVSKTFSLQSLLETGLGSREEQEKRTLSIQENEQFITNLLQEKQVDPKYIDLVLAVTKTTKSYGPFPLLTAELKQTIRGWMRRSDERLLLLAGFLYEYQLRSSRVTECRMSLLKTFLQYYIQIEADEETLLIEAERLAQQAKDVDLVTTPRNLDLEIEASRNDPRLEFRPAMHSVGQYVYLFNREIDALYWRF